MSWRTACRTACGPRALRAFCRQIAVHGQGVAAAAAVPMRRHGVSGPGMMGLGQRQFRPEYRLHARATSSPAPRPSTSASCSSARPSHRGRGRGVPWERVTPPGGGVRLAGNAVQRGRRASTGTVTRHSRGEDCQVILSTGSGVAIADLGPAAAELHRAALRAAARSAGRAAAFVIHGGMNSVNESLMLRRAAAGDSADGRAARSSGRRVEELGAGLLSVEGRSTADSCATGCAVCWTTGASASRRRRGAPELPDCGRRGRARRTSIRGFTRTSIAFQDVFIVADAEHFAAANQRQLEQLRDPCSMRAAVRHRRACSISGRRRCTPCLRYRAGRRGRSAR